MFYIANYVESNSDLATMVFGADDMIHGDFFRSSWTLSGISFTFTDMPYFVIGTILKGVSPTAYVIACALMIFMLAISAWFLVKDKIRTQSMKYKFFYFLLFLLVCCTMNDFLSNILRIHTGSVILAFVGLYFLDKFLNDSNTNKKISVICTAVLFLFSCWGDRVGLLIVILPAIILQMLDIFDRYNSNGQIEKSIITFIIICAGALAGLLLDKLYFIIGGADPNAFLSSKYFVNFSDYWDKIVLYLNCVFEMNGSAFQGKPILKISTIGYFAKAIIVISTFIIVFFNLKAIFMRQKGDYICQVLSLGHFLISLVFIITTISVDGSSSRYIAYFPACSAVLIIRTLILKPDILIEPDGKKLKYMTMICTLIILMIFELRNVPKMTTNISLPSEQVELVDALEEKGLTNGYSDFWNASNISLISSRG